MNLQIEFFLAIKIIVDGSNGAFYKRDSNKLAKIKNIKIILSFLKKLQDNMNIEYEIITDANLKYKIDNKEELEELYNSGKLIQCPGGIQADEFIIEYSRRHLH